MCLFESLLFMQTKMKAALHWPETHVYFPKRWKALVADTNTWMYDNYGQQVQLW